GDGLVRQPAGDAGAAADRVNGSCDIGSNERREFVCAPADVVQHLQRDTTPGVVEDEVVQFREYERRENSRLRVLQDANRLAVQRLQVVVESEQSARIDEDQSRPKPSARSSSTRPARLPWEKRGARGLGTCCATTDAMPSRMRSASLRPVDDAARSSARFKSSGRYTVVLPTPSLLPYVQRPQVAAADLPRGAVLARDRGIAGRE